MSKMTYCFATSGFYIAIRNEINEKNVNNLKLNDTVVENYTMNIINEESAVYA